jgi:hypothetical protein
MCAAILVVSGSGNLMVGQWAGRVWLAACRRKELAARYLKPDQEQRSSKICAIVEVNAGLSSRQRSAVLSSAFANEEFEKFLERMASVIKVHRATTMDR